MTRRFKQKMGLGSLGSFGRSGPSACGVSRRAYLNVENATEIIKECSQHRVAFVWGIVVVIAALLAAGYALTRQNEHEATPRKNFYVPRWTPFVPLLFGLLYTQSATSGALDTWRAEQLEFALSGMPKKEYLQFKVGDDRTNTGFLGTATSAVLLSGTNVLGPFLRADR